MKKPDLKPCPFCGGKAEYYNRYDFDAGESGMRWISAICVACDVDKDGDPWAMGTDQPANAHETAAFAWNKRAAQ